MMSHRPEVVYGYHGCDESVAKRVYPLDCLVLNMVCDYAAQKKRPYDVIRGAFPDGDPIFPGSMLLAKTHIQLCVRNSAKIVRLFRA